MRHSNRFLRHVRNATTLQRRPFLPQRHGLVPGHNQMQHRQQRDGNIVDGNGCAMVRQVRLPSADASASRSLHANAQRPLRLPRFDTLPRQEIRRYVAPTEKHQRTASRIGRRAVRVDGSRLFQRRIESFRWAGL